MWLSPKSDIDYIHEHYVQTKGIPNNLKPHATIQVPLLIPMEIYMFSLCIQVSMEVSIIRALVVLLCVSTVSCQLSSDFVPCANPPSGSASTDQPPLPQLPNQFSVHIEANIVQVSI